MFRKESYVPSFSYEKIAVQFFSEVSYFEQTKRAALNKT